MPLPTKPRDRGTHLGLTTLSELHGLRSRAYLAYCASVMTKARLQF